MLFDLGAQKYNQNNLSTLLNSSDLAWLSGFFRAWFGLQISFRVRANFWVRAGSGPELMGPFTTQLKTQSVKPQFVLSQGFSLGFVAQRGRK